MTTSITPIADIDPVMIEDLSDLAEVEAEKCTSIYLPTHRTGPETMRDPKALGQLLDRAAELGAEADVLAPMRALMEDTTFWQHQGESLALFGAKGFFRRYRLPVEVDEELDVSDTFRVCPLVPFVSTGATFRILALAQNSVRLFEASRYRIEEVDLPAVPRSMDEALATEDRDARLHRTSGAGSFHGHGDGEDFARGDLERFFRAVDHGLREQHGVLDIPLVIASVGYYGPMYAAVSSAYPNVVEDVVEGSPERRPAAELHAEAWEIFDRYRSSQGDSPWDRYQNALGSDLASSDLSTVVLSAATGRVDTIFVAPGPRILGTIDIEGSAVRVADGDAPIEELRTSLVDRAVLDTVRHGGGVMSIEPDDLPDDEHLAALFRY